MEFSGFLEEKGWRSDAPWKPRRFSLKGRVLRSYVGDHERNSYIIDAESFISVIPPGVNENGTKSIADEYHKYVFSICTKSFAPAFSKNKIVLAAPNETSFNSWIKAFSESAFEGVTENIPELWPDSFRNQRDLFTISFNGRNVSDGSTFSSFQVEVAPLHTSSDTRAVQKNNLKLVKHLWSYSNSVHSLSSNCPISNIAAPGDVPALPLSSHPGLKLHYTLILVSAQTMPGLEGNWSDEFSLLWMVANLKSNIGIPSDLLNGQEIFPYEDPSPPFGCEKRKCFFLLFTQPDGLFCEVNINRMKNNFKIMKTKADLNEPLKNLGSFSNPKIWAQEMGFFNPAWVVSFYAQSCEMVESKGSDPTVHLNIYFKSHNTIRTSIDSNDTSDSPESTTFSFRNNEVLKPQRLTHQPSAIISLNNAERSRNESFNYNSGDELEGIRVKRKRPGLADKARNTICGSDIGNLGNARSVSMRSLCSSSVTDKTLFSRSQSLSGAIWQRCYNDKGQYDEVETLKRIEAKRKTYSSLEERPPFYPPYSKGIPTLYGVHHLLRQSSSISSIGISIGSSISKSKNCSTDSPQMKRLNSDISATPERGNAREISCRSMPLLSYDESEFDDQTTDVVSVDMDEEVEALHQEADMKVLLEYAEMTKYDGQSFTMVLSSPDFPLESDNEAGGEFVHWVVVNITGLDVRTGAVVAPYVGPCPPCNSGLHRHFFRLYLQEAYLTPMEVSDAKDFFSRRDGRPTAKWFAECKLQEPLAVRSFRTSWDESCDATHVKLGYRPCDEFLCPKDKRKIVEAAEEKERVRLAEVAAAAAAEKERLRILLEAAEKERLRLKALAAEEHRLRLEAIAAEEERLRIVAAEAEKERLRLIAEAIENERLRLEEVAAAEKERLRLIAVAEEEERLRILLEAAENERLRLAAVEAEKERLRLIAEAIENERLRLEELAAAEKERLRLKAIAEEEQRLRVQAAFREQERVWLIEKERLRLAALAIETERLRVLAEEDETERLRLEAIATEERRLQAEASAIKMEKLRIEAEMAEKEGLRLIAEAEENERLRRIALAEKEEMLRLEAIASEEAERVRREGVVVAEKQRNKLAAEAAEKERLWLEAVAAKERERLELLAEAAERDRLFRLALATAEKERQRLAAEAEEKGRARSESIALAERERIRVLAEANEAKRQKQEADRLQIELEVATAYRLKEEAIEAAAEERRLRLVAAEIEADRLRREADAAAEAEAERLRLIKEENAQAKRLQKIEDAMTLAERRRQEADEEEERRRLQEIDEAKRRERFRLISNKWNSTSSPKLGEEKSRFDMVNSGRPSPEKKVGEPSGESALEATERRQREYKERSEKASKERIEKEARDKLERAENLRREMAEKELEQKRLRELEDRTAFVFEVVFPPEQALELTLFPIKIGCTSLEESKSGMAECETVMDCCLVTASKNNNLPSNILPGDLLVHVNQQLLYSPQKSSESPDNFAESAVKRISQAEEPRTAMVFRLLRKGSPDNRKSERYLSIENTARSIPLSLQCSRSGKVLPLSEAETSLFVTGVPNSCH